MYFSEFPTLQYTFGKEQNFRLVTDIIKRIKFRDSIITEASIYNIYNVRDGETPEILAAKFYGNPNYHWVLLMTNQIINPYFDWPLSTNDLNEYIKSKYTGSFTTGNPPVTVPNFYAVHHYELVSPYAWRNGMTMPTPTDLEGFDPDFTAKLYNTDTEEITVKTNYDYETELNDNRRAIKLIKTAYLSQIFAELTDLLKQ